MQTLLDKIQDLLDVKQIHPQDKLKDFEEWDSLSMIALISFGEKYYQIHLTLDMLSACESIEDICSLFSKASNGGGGLNNLSNCLEDYPYLNNPYYSVQTRHRLSV